MRQIQDSHASSQWSSDKIQSPLHEYYVNQFSQQIVSATAFNTSSLHCPYCSANQAEELYLEIPIHRQNNCVSREFEVCKLNVGDSDQPREGVFVVGIVPGSTTALEDRLRMFDEIIQVSDGSKELSHTQDTPISANELMNQLQLIYSKTSAFAVRLIVRRWQDSQPFDKWEIIPHGSHNDETYEFMSKYRNYVQASMQTTVTVPAKPSLELPQVCESNMASFGFRPVCFDNELTFKKDGTGHSAAPNVLKRCQVADLIRLAIEYSNI